MRDKDKEVQESINLKKKTIDSCAICEEVHRLWDLVPCRICGRYVCQECSTEPGSIATTCVECAAKKETGL